MYLSGAIESDIGNVPYSKNLFVVCELCIYWVWMRNVKESWFWLYSPETIAKHWIVILRWMHLTNNCNTIVTHFVIHSICFHFSLKNKTACDGSMDFIIRQGVIIFLLSISLNEIVFDCDCICSRIFILPSCTHFIAPTIFIYLIHFDNVSNFIHWVNKLFLWIAQLKFIHNLVAIIYRTHSQYNIYYIFHKHPERPLNTKVKSDLLILWWEKEKPFARMLQLNYFDEISVIQLII